jgi:LmbE family N-acetylglucosaminyl deacetylase/glycosyltransferase involved in cell wall biosynthesis
MEEASLIPYSASELAGSRILVLAAHPDDETLGAGGVLALNAEKAEAVRIWIATGGARQEGGGGDEGYGERRREESREAARALGLEPPLFGSLPDRELSSRGEDVAAEVGKLIADFRPDLVLCPSPVEIHPDHRALAEAAWGRLSSSRPADPDHGLYAFLRLAFYEISHPILPNTLVDISGVAERKEKALSAYASQQSVRDYAGALGGLNAYRRLTLQGTGPVEAFRVVEYREASTRSLEEFRRSIGPSIVRDGERGPAPVSVVVRTRNRPALLREGLESLQRQTARPRQVVVVNDGGASVSEIARAFGDSFDVTLEELPERKGRSHAANRGVALAREELTAFLDDDDIAYPDHLERLVRAHRAGPEPVVYSDAVTAVYGRRDEQPEAIHRSLQYSLDYDPDLLLLANYIPLHTLLLPRALYTGTGGFDEKLDYSEDWDFLIRLSFETSFRHLRAVTCEYRVFETSGGESGKVRAGEDPFQKARGVLYERYASRRTNEGLARVIDRLRSQIAFWAERDSLSQGELKYQRESHRGLMATLERTGQRLGKAESNRDRLAAERDTLAAELEAERRRVSDLIAASKELTLERDRLLAENELVHNRVEDLFASNEEYYRKTAELQAEVTRLNGLLAQIYASRTWKLHLLAERVRGRR